MRDFRMVASGLLLILGMPTFANETNRFSDLVMNRSKHPHAQCEGFDQTLEKILYQINKMTEITDQERHLFCDWSNCNISGTIKLDGEVFSTKINQAGFMWLFQNDKGSAAVKVFGLFDSWMEPFSGSCSFQNLSD